jgi:dihydrofolate reductase
MGENLIDEYWLFVNPILLGKGIPVFDRIKQRIGLVLIDTKVFASGITGLHYQVDR